MPLQVWEVVVHGEAHRVELERNADTGKHLLRVDGRIAVKPFAGGSGEFALDVAGRPFLLRVAEGQYALEDKGSRYVDPAAPRSAAAIGRVTVCRGLEQITAVTDGALIRIERIAEGLKGAMMISSGGGALGALAAGIGLEVAERLSNRLGPTTREHPIRSFEELAAEVTCRLEHLPIDLVALFSGEVDVDARVLVVPRSAVTGIETARAKLLVRTNRSGDKPHKFETGAQRQEAVEHLYAAGYPLDPEAVATIDAEAVAEAARLRAAPPMENASPPPPPAQAAAPVIRAGGLPQIRRAAALVTGVGLEPAHVPQLEADAEAYRTCYPKTALRRLKLSETLRQLDRERFDIVHLLGVYDEKTRFREATGSPLSLRDLIEQLGQRGARLVWFASGNDEAAAEATLRWAGGLNQLIVLTVVRGPDHRFVLREALQRLSRGEALSATLPEIEKRSECRFRIAGRGDAIFLAD